MNIYIERSLNSPEERLDVGGATASEGALLCLLICSLSTAEIMAEVTAEEEDEKDEDGTYRLVPSWPTPLSLSPLSAPSLYNRNMSSLHTFSNLTDALSDHS